MKKFRYFSYHSGCNAEIELPDEKVAELTAEFNKNPERMRRLGCETADDYIIAVLAFNC